MALLLIKLFRQVVSIKNKTHKNKPNKQQQQQHRNTPANKQTKNGNKRTDKQNYLAEQNNNKNQNLSDLMSHAVFWGVKSQR